MSNFIFNFEQVFQAVVLRQGELMTTARGMMPRSDPLTAGTFQGGIYE